MPLSTEAETPVDHDGDRRRRLLRSLGLVGQREQLVGDLVCLVYRES